MTFDLQEMQILVLSPLECKALWLCADIGYQMPNPALEKDPFLEAAAHRAVEKVWRLHKRMPDKPEAA